MQTELIATPVAQQSVKSVRLILLFIVCFAGNMFAGSVSTLMAVYLHVVVREFQGNQSSAQLNSISAYINSLFIFGWATGGFLWGLISDKTGRKAALLLSIGSYGIFTMLTAFSQSWGEVMICRFFSGFGAGGLLVISFTLISEVWPEKSKAVFTGILSIAIPIGIFSTGLLNYIVASWRQGFLVGVLPVLFAIAGYWMIDESGLWLKDKSEEQMDKKHAPHLFGASNLRILIVGSVIFGTMLIGLWAIFSWLPTWIQSLMSTDAHKEGDLSIMFLGMGGLIGGFLSGWVVKLVGLRTSLIASFVVCFALSFILFKTNSSFSPVIYAEIAVLALFFGASQGILSLYIPALFPAVIRASATGFCFNTGRLLTALAVLFAGVLVDVLGGYGNSLFIFSFVFLMGLLVVVFVKNIQPVQPAE
ncbi:MFS transporter [Mucilaginibacter gotjawali]|uniref:MFS family permease n=2 Tax=Mucilaginibacter gotjawali TaxID=1550579 RepID=A0A839SH45_9SPHI|nr:MFS transporter [Mucilaginibacter gotjawali]MBB3056623.1 MFS family permease [Mucilaginibacter gotjawali]BAU52674.1 putative niacin/nicotinamide transporter NaiP [Mucilaginibacter gotjawali]